MTSTLSAVDPAAVSPLRLTGAGIEDLTERELDVITLITNGYSNAEISRELFLSLNSVKTYIRAGYRKTGALSRSHAIIWGVRHGLLAGVPASDGAA